jgi:hypothetical protein
VHELLSMGAAGAAECCRLLFGVEVLQALGVVLSSSWSRCWLAWRKLPGVSKCCRCCCPSEEGAAVAAECCCCPCCQVLPSAVQAWRKVLPMRGEPVQQLQVLSRCAQFQLLSIWCCPSGLSFAFIYIYFFLTLTFSHFIYEMPHLSN